MGQPEKWHRGERQLDVYEEVKVVRPCGKVKDEPGSSGRQAGGRQGQLWRALCTTLGPKPTGRRESWRAAIRGLKWSAFWWLGH